MRGFLVNMGRKLKSSFKSFAFVRIILFVLAGALAITAGVYAYTLWQEGVRAEKNAQEILSVSGFADLGGAAVREETDSQGYVQPQEPEAEAGALDGLLDSELKGYSVIARLDIPVIDVSLPVLSETTDMALGYSVCYYSGPEAGGEGNLVITGHNYASGAHFGNLDKVKTGDEVMLVAPDGSEFIYTVYDTQLITPDDVQALSETSYDRELTLLTCEENANRRLLVRCREMGGQ